MFPRNGHECLNGGDARASSVKMRRKVEKDVEDQWVNRFSGDFEQRLRMNRDDEVRSVGNGGSPVMTSTSCSTGRMERVVHNIRNSDITENSVATPPVYRRQPDNGTTNKFYWRNGETSFGTPVGCRRDVGTPLGRRHVGTPESYRREGGRMILSPRSECGEVGMRIIHERSGDLLNSPSR